VRAFGLSFLVSDYMYSSLRVLSGIGPPVTREEGTKRRESILTADGRPPCSPLSDHSDALARQSVLPATRYATMGTCPNVSSSVTRSPNSLPTFPASLPSHPPACPRTNCRRTRTTCRRCRVSSNRWHP